MAVRNSTSSAPARATLRRVRTRHAPASIVAAWVVAATVAAVSCSSDGSGPSTITDSFDGPDGLIAAEQHPAEDGSPWTMTSGSLFRSAEAGWTGVPDDGRASGSTGSAVFRMVSTEQAFGDVTVSLRLRVDRLVETDRTPAQDYDGAHIWLRYESDRQLYAVSVDRRDGVLVVKKKCPGGDSNGGTYLDLADEVPDVPIPFGDWQNVTVSVRNQRDGSVEITGSRDGHEVTAVDRGQGCPAIRGAGGIGIRGDNSELRFDDITVRPVDSQD